MKSLIILLFCAQLAQGQIYKWVDDNGKVHYSDAIPEGKDALKAEVEIKNSQLQIMGEKDNRLLESFDTEREKREEANQREQEKLDKAAAQAESKTRDKDSLLRKHKCFGPSPSSTPSGLSRLDVNPRELNNSQVRMLSNLFDQIRGSWKGEVDGFTCLGQSEAPEQRPENFEVRAEAGLDNFSTLRFHADLESKNSGSRRTERYDFYVKDNLLRLGSPNAAGDIELRHLTKSGFTVLQKKWTGKGWQHHIFAETLIAINLNENALTIERISYTNGILGGVSVWRLQKY